MQLRYLRSNRQVALWLAPSVAPPPSGLPINVPFGRGRARLDMEAPDAGWRHRDKVCDSSGSVIDGTAQAREARRHVSDVGPDGARIPATATLSTRVRPTAASPGTAPGTAQTAGVAGSRVGESGRCDLGGRGSEKETRAIGPDQGAIRRPRSWGERLCLGVFGA